MRAISSRERETERRLVAAREAAEAASAAKTDFLAQVSHEIRTPLHAILGFAEVMLEERFGPVGNERYKDYLKDIHASGSHVMSLADDLLDLSKIEAGKLELAFASVDANSVIRECVSLMQPQAARERVIMRVSLHDRLPRVMVDERSLKQIMLNLMSNAVKFNEPGGQVIVSTAVDAAGQAVIRVRDTGVGMNENEVGLALTPFSQVGKGGRQGRGRSRPAADQGAGRSQQGRVFDQEPPRARHADRDRLPQHPGGAIGGASGRPRQCFQSFPTRFSSTLAIARFAPAGPARKPSALGVASYNMLSLISYSLGAADMPDLLVRGVGDGDRPGAQGARRGAWPERGSRTSRNPQGGARASSPAHLCRGSGVNA